MPGLYIHIPFCEHKCIYCDFYSVAPRETRPHSELPTLSFVDSLTREILIRGAEERFRVSYDTVFFGGGTPTLLNEREIGAILDALARAFEIRSDAEITIEANPGTVNQEKLRAFRGLGINRISFGVQSFHEDDLRFLTRIHSADEARRCVHDAYRSGFENVSLDLMFALPGQTTERWRSNLDEAIKLAPTHLSCYSLIVEPNTPLSRMVSAKQISLLGVEDDAGLYELTMERLAANGYEQYEVSNFAKPGYKCRHNICYWSHSSYLGFGPSAHSYWRASGSPGDSKRWWNVSSITGYNDTLGAGSLPVAGCESLTADQLRHEEFFLGLRSEGIDVSGFYRRHGRDLEIERGLQLDELISRELAVMENGRLRLTSKGYLVCDEICASMDI